MNMDTMEGKWMEIKGKAREKWGRISEDEFDVIGGKRDQLEGKIQSVYGKTKEEAKAEVDQWSKSCGCK